MVLAGNAFSPLTKSLAIDLERRGFIVYVSTNTPAEEASVRGEMRADLRALEMDVTNVSSRGLCIKRGGDDDCMLKSQTRIQTRKESIKTISKKNYR